MLVCVYVGECVEKDISKETTQSKWKHLMCKGVPHLLISHQEQIYGIDCENGNHADESGRYESLSVEGQWTYMIIDDLKNFFCIGNVHEPGYKAFVDIVLYLGPRCAQDMLMFRSMIMIMPMSMPMPMSVNVICYYQNQ